MTNTAPKKAGKKRKTIWFAILLASIILVAAWMLLDRWSKKKGFSGAGDFVKTVVVNYWTSFDAVYETAEITLSESDFDKLAAQREAHLKRGIITKTNDRYVPAIISFKGNKIKCRIRLKGHMTDHLQDQKWSFRVKTTGGDAFKGMKIFSLQHPGTRNYIYEWIYHQMLEDEGLATVRYSFINLKVNGDSWGIYAVEENFANELVANHQLPKGPIVGFNPDMYWYTRLNAHDKKKVNYDNYQFNATFPEAYNEEDLFTSSEQRKNYAEALVKLHKFRSGEMTTSEVFDVEKLARFHAIIDLVGGHFSLDWSDVKYYYNPQTQKIEPVGYESFSVQNTAYLSGAFRFKNKLPKIPELHDLLFSDWDFFNAYIKHLRRISDKKYLDAFFNRHDKELKNNLAILYSEFPYKKLELTPYYRNQDNIKTLLNEPVTNVCYLEKAKNDSLYLTMGNTGVLPLQIVSLTYNNLKFDLDSLTCTSTRSKNESIHYESMAIPFKKPENFDERKLELNVRKAGSKEIVSLKIRPVDFNDELNEFTDLLSMAPNYKKFDFLLVDEDKKTITISPGDYVVSENIIFPDGYVVYGKAPLRIVLNNQAAIVSRSAFKLTGTEEDPVVIETTDSTGKGFIFSQTASTSGFSFVQFIGLSASSKKNETHNAILSFYESAASFKNCSFSAMAKSGIHTVRSILKMSDCEFFNLEDAVEADFSTIDGSNLVFGLIRGNAFQLNAVFGKVKGAKIYESASGIEANNGTNMMMVAISLTNVKTGITATDMSLLKLQNVKMDQVETGFVAEKKSEVFGPAKMVITGLTQKNVKSLKESDKKSVIQIK